MARNSRLGSGLESIFGDNVTDVLDEIQNSAKGENYGRKLVLPVSEIHANPYQPRKTFDQAKLEELATSIKENGVFTPILVRKDVNGGYQLIAGERRWRACQIAAVKEIPAIIMEFNDQQMMEISLLENIQREDLNDIEVGQGYQKLMDAFQYTQQQLADKLGKSRESIANALRLLKLPKDVQQLLIDKKLSMGHVRPLITLEADKISALAKKIVAEGLSVRQVEALVKQGQTEVKPVVKKKVDPFVSDIENKLKEKLSTKVKISDNSINIAYNDQDDLNRLLQLLGIID